MATWNKITDEKINIIKKLSEKGLTLKEISLETKINYCTISIICKKNNINVKREPVKNRTKVNDDIFSTINSNSAYLAGFIAADGYLSHKKVNAKEIVISLSIKDYEHLEKIKKMFSYEGCIKIYEKKINKKKIKICNLRISSEKIFDSLTSIGITPKKTFRLEVPKIPKEFIHDFIRGYFDGDGCFYINDGKFQKRITPELRMNMLGTETLLNWILKNFQIYYGKEVGKINCQKNSNYYYFRLGSASAVAFGDFIYQNSNSENRLDRKYNKYKEIKDYKIEHISSI